MNDVVVASAVAGRGDVDVEGISMTVVAGVDDPRKVVNLVEVVYPVDGVSAVDGRPEDGAIPITEDPVNGPGVVVGKARPELEGGIPSSLPLLLFRNRRGGTGGALKDPDPSPVAGVLNALGGSLGAP